MFSLKMRGIKAELLGLLILASCNQSDFYEKEYLSANLQQDEERLGDVIVPESIAPVVETPSTGPSENPVTSTPESNDPITNVPNTPEVDNPTDTTPVTTVLEDSNPVVVVPEPVEEVVQEISYKEVVEEFIQNKEEKRQLDVVWVVDNSGSMRDEQESLARNFSIFIKDFVTEKIDFQMSIINTDMDTASSRYRRSSRLHLGEAVPGSMLSLTSKKLTEDEDEFIDNFKKMIKVGTSGSGREKGLLASSVFAEKHKSWIRTDAMLVVIYLSDENDSSNGKTQDYVNYLQSLKESKGLVKLYSIITAEGDRRSGVESVGKRYIEAAKSTAGSSASINGDFYKILDEMGGTIVDLLSSFAIGSTPSDQKEVIVSVDGSVVKNGWVLDEKSRAIKFEDGSVPEAGSKIEVKYFLEG